MENLTLGKIFSILKRNSRIIFLFAIVGLVAGILYASIIYKPVYKSTARLLVKNNEQVPIITDIGNSNAVAPLTRDGNPTLTQIQIITSGTLADKVWNEISNKYSFKDNPNRGASLMQKAITVQNPVGTDIIEITATWSDPKIARDIANGFASAYINSNIDTSKRGIVQSLNSINSQLNVAQQNLLAVRDQIKQFRQANSTVDLEAEAGNIVTQLGNMENRYQEMVSAAGAEANRVSSIAGRLGIDWKQAINSVALGSNTNIAALQTRLGQTQEELAGLTTKYASSHPAVIALKARIDQIKSELSDQISQTIGSTVNKNEIMISDPVRTSMMNDLVTSEATYRGLLAQSNILESAVNLLRARKSSIPQKQQALSTLLQEESNWANIVNTLKAKQVEATIRESEIVSNINIIDSPNVPVSPAFPSRSTVAALFVLFGALLGITSVIINYFVKDNCDEIDQVEEELQAPVLGVIPWLDKQTYNEPDSLLAVESSASYYSFAYQKVISSLRIKGFNSKVKSLVFTSTEFSKVRSTMLMNIAYGLNKAGQSVIVVDADFRTPSIHKEFGLHTDDQFNLGELITNISREVMENGDFNWKYLSYYIQEVPGVKNLHILTNNSNINDPYEYLHAPSFNLLVQKLKEQYDWVLLDAPPAMAVPDAVTIGSYADGVVLTTGLEITKSMLRKVRKLFSVNHIPVFGVVAREIQTGEAVTSNEYLRQIISHMIPQPDEALIKK